MKPELKQKNKKHKPAEKTKRQLKADNKGKISKSAKAKSKMKKSNKVIRKMQRKNKLKKQNQEVAMERAAYGGHSGAPILCVVVPLDAVVSPELVQSAFRKSVDNSNWQKAKPGGSSYLSVPEFRKRLAIRVASYSNLYMTLDMVKVADFVVFVINSVESFEMDAYGHTLLAALYGQGLPHCAYVALNESVKLASLRKLIESKYPVERNQFWLIDRPGPTKQFLRHICQGLPTRLTYRDWRSYLLVDEVNYMANKDGAKLEVCGHIRGRPLNVNTRVHITGWGDFAIEQVDRQVDPCPARPQTTPDPLDVEGVVLARPGPVCEEAVMEEADAAMEGKEMEDDSDDDSSEENEASLDGSEMDEEDEENVEEEEDADDDEAMVVEEDADQSHDAELVRFRRSREEEEFPDEVDTPIDQPARKRFSKYRSIVSLRDSWDIDSANVPSECRNLLCFSNFRHFRNRVAKAINAATTSENGADASLRIAVGRYVRLHLRPLAGANLDRFLTHRLPAHPLVVFSLLPTEDKLSMVHCSLRGHRVRTPVDPHEEQEEDTVQLDLSNFDASDVGEYYPTERKGQRRAAEASPVCSKDPMVLQIGFRRLLARPIYSEDSRAAPWYKYRRFFSDSEPMVASLVAPVLLSPCPVLMFRGACREYLVATGSMAGCNPRRRCLKRVLLSGHLLKVHGRTAVVRYMFFNPDDVDYFKSVGLRTKRGCRGRILESLGTHGLMKCRFDRGLTQMDVPLMPLYKPVYPKGVAEVAPLGRMKEPRYLRN